MIYTLFDFVHESNRIEGIDGVQCGIIGAHGKFLDLEILTFHDITSLAKRFGDHNRLRDKPGMDVRVGLHVPPAGGPQVVKELQRWVDAYGQNPDPARAYESHQCFEALHPFMDGNGRTGRLLWLWMMGGIEKAPLGFLHTWYYQSLNAGRS